MEFVGLEGELAAYDNSLERKREMWQKRGIAIVEIYPKDLFPKNKLGTVLKDLVS